MRDWNDLDANNSTTAPICGVPSELLTTPEMEPEEAADAGAAIISSESSHPICFVIPTTSFQRELRG